MNCYCCSIGFTLAPLLVIGTPLDLIDVRSQGRMPKATLSSPMTKSSKRTMVPLSRIATVKMRQRIERKGLQHMANKNASVVHRPNRMMSSPSANKIKKHIACQLS